MTEKDRKEYEHAGKVFDWLVILVMALYVSLANEFNLPALWNYLMLQDPLPSFLLYILWLLFAIMPIFIVYVIYKIVNM